MKVPNAAAPLDLIADLRTRRFTTATEIRAPQEGGAKRRLNWMLRQTQDMPTDLFIDVRYPNIREWVSARNVDAQDDPERLLCPSDPKREPRAFRLHRDGKMGRKAGKDQGSFAGESRNLLHEFYRDVLQNIQAWQPPAPKLPREPEPASDEHDAVAPRTPDDGELT